jgi:hypothetical protein
VAGKIKQIPRRLSERRLTGTRSMDDVVSTFLGSFQNPFGSLEDDEATRRQIWRQFPELRTIQRPSEIGNLLLGYRSWLVLV